MARTRHAAVGSGADAHDAVDRESERVRRHSRPPVAPWAKQGHVEAREMRARLRFENVLRHLSHIQTAETGSINSL